MTPKGATLVVLIFGIGNFLGTCIGGICSSHIYITYGPRYTALLSGGAAIAGCFPLWALINNTSSNDSRIMLGSISLIAGSLSAVTGPIVKSTLQNVSQPQMRGMAFALLNTFDDFGRGLGPAFVAWMIGKFDGRRNAFNVGVCGWLFCGILNGMLYFTVERDEERVRVNTDRLFRPEKDEEDLKDKVRMMVSVVNLFRVIMLSLSYLTIGLTKAVVSHLTEAPAEWNQLGMCHQQR
jgi:MFS family permease